MNELPEPDGTAVQFYLPRLDDEALEEIQAFARRTYDGEAKRFAEFLFDAAEDEKQRRMDAGSEPRERDLPRVDTFSWHDHDVAEALKACTSWSYAVADPVIGEFVDKCVLLIVALARYRLNRSCEVT